MGLTRGFRGTASKVTDYEDRSSS